MTAALFARLTTARLTLDALVPGDAAALVAGLGDREVSRWLSRVPSPYRAADAEAFIELAAGQRGRIWAIRDGDGLAGVIGRDDGLGYWLARPVWGRGYAVEAGRAVLAAHFADPAATTLEAGVMDGNPRSARVLAALGFADAGPRDVPSRRLGAPQPGRAFRLTRAGFNAAHALVLDTPRLRLRPLSLGDAPALARIGGDARVAPMIHWATVPWPQPEAHRFVAHFLWRGALPFRLAICLKPEGRLIGTIGASAAPEVFYFLDPAHWGRGLMGEALAAFLPPVFARFGLDAIAAEVYDDNPASARVLTRAGFVRTGAGSCRSPARLEPAPVSVYRLDANSLGGVPR